MTNKRYFLLAGILAFIGLAGVSCSVNGENYPIVTLTPVTHTPVATQPPTDIPTPTLLPTFTPNPLFTITPSPTAVSPYPTANVVNANAVAFIAENALWIANVDGSGERKLVENIGKWSNTTNYFLRWSPNGKWISYISNDEMWIISPDGLEKKKVWPAFDKNKRLMSYNWSPDDSQVAYVEVSLLNSKFDSESVKILNLKTEETYEVSTHKSQFYGTILRWSPNGQFLAFNKDASFIVFDTTNHKVKQEILTDTYFCSSTDNTAPVWSPNSKWFFHEHGASAHYTFLYICISALDGSNRRVEMDGTIYSDVVWDQTGNFLYFVARNIDPNGDPNLDADQRLQRYDVRTQKLERLLSLGQKYRSAWSVSISPDDRTLQTHTQISEDQQSYTLINLKSLSTEQFISNFGREWSTDSQNFICVSESNGYSVFHRMDIHTRETSIISGEHLLESWVVSPIVTTP
jgi:hypothetical protein